MCKTKNRQIPDKCFLIFNFIIFAAPVAAAAASAAAIAIILVRSIHPFILGWILKQPYIEEIFNHLRSEPFQHFLERYRMNLNSTLNL